MTISAKRLVPKHVAPTTMCSAKIHDLVEIRWRKHLTEDGRHRKVWGADNLGCSFAALFEIEGNHYCRRHAGSKALELLLKGNQ